MKEKLRQFMTGRYGTDQLNRCIIIAALIFVVINVWVRSDILSFVSMLLLIICYFRMFSRNVSKRYKENQIYLGYQYKVTGVFQRGKYNLDQAKTYHIYKCPDCAQKIRIPRGKGKISIHCPKCGKDFIKKS